MGLKASKQFKKKKKEHAGARLRLHTHLYVDVQVGLYVDPLTIGAEPVCDSLACR